ncbi:restriction endonuclease subunit S [Flavobacterium limnophilum]|uniref:restriction endonuclease subunit S n=1 Tax=Flavobacterium limnophilum TaxID=3003262 RepID=UPI002482315F|nr:restriction endonuclease subunit S [Flavobacterium limnophilum]
MSNKLPKDWKIVSISKIGKIETGTTPSKAITEYYGTEYPFYKPSDLDAGINVFKSIDGLTKLGVDKARYVAENTTLVTCIGATIGKTGYLKKGGGFNQQINAIIPNVGVNPKFIYYQAIGLDFQKQIKNNASATTLPLLNKSKFQLLTMVNCPLENQTLIVSKIEELFSELDKGIEDLKTAQQQLKTYRQSVLKWAFEGRLTNKKVKDWKLPKGWKLLTLDNVTKKITDGEHFRPQTQETGIPFLSAKDVQSNGVSFDKPLYISKETAKKALQRCNPERGDILIVSRGATVGRMCIVNTDNQFCLLGSVILIKVNNSIDSKLLNYLLKSPIANQKMITVSGATAQQAIYLRDIKKIEISLPPLEEQHQIVQEIESRLSVADKMEESISQSLLQAEALRQSILKKAFSGELV